MGVIDTTGFLEELQSTQSRFIAALEDIDAGSHFFRDSWSYAPRGGGVTAVLEQGTVFESAAINFSHVSGEQLPPTASHIRPELSGHQFEAMGLSLIFHPHNPFVPTVHFNVRVFHAHKGNDQSTWWFGGGMDLTPYYGFAEDAKHFHVTIRDALAPHGEALYPRFKQQCDAYFYLKHRQEARGIGGIFFDDFDLNGDFDATHRMVSAVINAFLPAYLPIVKRRQSLPYTEAHKNFQHYRRGRYVEFNLLYDRGTLFGIQSGGRTESILCSLPRIVHWRYNWHPEEGSAEHALYTDFLVPRDWANLSHE